MTAETWKDIAILLGERMYHYAYGCDHDPLDPDNCPFCADRAAYLAYVAKRERSKRHG